MFHDSHRYRALCLKLTEALSEEHAKNVSLAIFVGIYIVVKTTLFYSYVIDPNVISTLTREKASDSASF